MVFTPSSLADGDLKRYNWTGLAGTGSETYINAAVSGLISLDAVYVQSGNIQPIDADVVFGISGNSLPVTQNTSPWVISGTASIGSQAGLYCILCGVQSGTTTVLPLICTAAGALIFASGVNA